MVPLGVSSSVEGVSGDRQAHPDRHFPRLLFYTTYGVKTLFMAAPGLGLDIVMPEGKYFE
jgi:hypothetical protein